MPAETSKEPQSIVFSPGGAFLAGKEVVTASLMEELVSRGRNIHAVICGWHDGRYPEMLRKAGIAFSEIHLGALSKARLDWTAETLWRLPAASLKHARLLRRLEPDVYVHTDLRIFNVARALSPRRTRHFLHIHDDDVMNTRYPGVARGALLADGILCVSRFVSRQFDGRPEAPRVQVVHNGVPQREALARSRGERLQIGIVGQLIPRKRHGVLVDALGLLAQRNGIRLPEMRIFGSVPDDEKARLEARARKVGVTSPLKWEGFVASPEAIYGKIDLLAAPAVAEPFGTTVLEAASFGIPSIAANTGGFPEMIQARSTGLLFEPDNAHAMADALELVIANDEFRLAMGARARHLVQNRFSVPQMATNFLRALAIPW